MAGSLYAALDRSTPLHLQIRSAMRASIESLEHPPGSRLPPERVLAEMYGVSRITVRSALDALSREGLVRRGRGRGGGTFVQDFGRHARSPKIAGSFAALYSSRQIERVNILAFERRASSGEVSAALGIPPNSPIRYIERLLIAPTGPLLYVRNFLPPAVGDRIRRQDLKHLMLHEALIRLHRIKIKEARDEIEAIVADTVAARLLECELGRPIVRVRRTLRGPRSVVGLSLMLIATHRYQLVVRHPGRSE
jgi:GntR family transcriptional regulator